MKIELLQQENDEISEELKEVEASFDEERESWEKEMEDLRATQAENKQDVDKQIALCKNDMRAEVKELVKEVVKQAIMEIPAVQTMGHHMEGIGQKMEDMGQKMEEMNMNIEKVKEEISMKKEPIVPQITAVAVAESNPTGISPYSFCTLSSNNKLNNYC